MTPTDEDALYEAALAVAKEQAARSAEGSGVGAAALTSTGDTLTGVWIDAMVDSACLCAETGPIGEAHRTGVKLTASICVYWRAEAGASVLAACGVCQERLAIFGTAVLIGIKDTSPRGYTFVPLRDLRPSPWWDAIRKA